MKIKNMCMAALGAALTAICAWISIPGPISFTMQTFAVFLTAQLLGRKYGTLSVAVYIALGAAGLPVFSGFRGGIGILAGATGGYIIGFLAIPLISGKKFGILTPAALIVCYAFGTAWYVLLYHVSLTGALMSCVVPFIIPDILKIALATFTAKRVKKYI